MLPVSSQLLGLSPPLPLELVRALAFYLDAPDACTLAETSRGGLWLMDGEGSVDLWRRWMARCLPPPPAIPGAPQPFLTLLAKSNTEGLVLPDPTTAPPSRPLVATFHLLRARAIRDSLAPLLFSCAALSGKRSPRYPRDHQQQAASQSPPCLVSQYFQAHDALAVLRAQGEAADTLLARELEALFPAEEDEEDEEDAMDIDGDGACKRAAASSQPPPLAPVALLLALHVLHRLVLSDGGAALDGWRRQALARLAEGPFIGMAAVAYWTMGSHNPFGFRARDVLRTEKVDLRQLALGILQRADQVAPKSISIPTSEPTGSKGPGDDAGTRLLARLESLRGIMPVSTLDPPVVYLEAAEPYLGGEGVGNLIVNAHGHFELSSSPPRR